MTSFDFGGIQPAPRAVPGYQARPGSPVVAVGATTPETAVADMGRAMDLAGVGEFLSPNIKTQLKVNISSQHWYPGCSTTPWQIEGVAKALQARGHKDLIAAHNGTVVAVKTESSSSKASSTQVAP